MNNSPAIRALSASTTLTRHNVDQGITHVAGGSDRGAHSVCNTVLPAASGRFVASELRPTLGITIRPADTRHSTTLWTSTLRGPANTLELKNQKNQDHNYNSD